MNRRSFIKKSLCSIPVLPLGIPPFSYKDKKYYKSHDFQKAPKIDAHFHYDIPNDTFIKYAISINMHLVSINVNAGIPVDQQLAITSLLASQYPDFFHFLGTFTLTGFGNETFITEKIAQINNAIEAGAKGIKIWKNIGMELTDKKGNYIMVDSSTLELIFRYLEKKKIPVSGHLGEPRNCWLPLEDMTMDNDYRYYSKHPQYHMYNHPEFPSYEEQITARDQLLNNFPRMIFIGAHIGSMEWNLNEVAHHFDKYPNFYIDLSARIGHIQLQALKNRKFVRDFFIQYQDRIIYGSDTTLNQIPDNIQERCTSLYHTWKNHWSYFATDEKLPAEKFKITNPPDKIVGLHLPKKVVDKIFYRNAVRIFDT